MKQAIWLSFDLGVTGDYEGIYTWLADHDAVECGDSLAFLRYEKRGDLLEDLKKDLENAVEINGKTRIYVIYRSEDDDKMKGKFLFGKHKQASWTGYGTSKEETSDEE
jgi:hypothetical protein